MYLHFVLYINFFDGTNSKFNKTALKGLQDVLEIKYLLEQLYMTGMAISNVVGLHSKMTLGVGVHQRRPILKMLMKYGRWLKKIQELLRTLGGYVGIRSSAVQSIIHDYLGLRKLAARWVPHF